MATKFADIAKGPKDLLNEDYTNKVSLKCKKNAGPVTVTIETEQAPGGALSTKIGSKFSYAKFNVDKGQVKADGGKVLETSLTVTPDLKLSFKANKGADLGFDYTKGNFYATGVMDVKDMSKVSATFCCSSPLGFKIGGEASYGLAKAPGFSGVNAGASYSSGPFFTSLTSSDGFSAVNLGLLYKVNPDISVGSMTTHSSTKICTFIAAGGSYKIPAGTLKAKVDGKGVVSCCFIREVAPKVTVTASGSMSPSDISTFSPGIAINM